VRRLLSETVVAMCEERLELGRYLEEQLALADAGGTIMYAHPA